MKKLSTLLAMGLLALTLACERAANENARTNANDNARTDTARDTDTNDTWITTKVKLALLADERVSGFATDVDTNNGIVTLSGTVDDETSKNAATEVARGIEGVKSVNNQLQVVPGTAREQVSASDDRIEDEIAKIMDSDQTLSEMSLSADSNAGVVTLDGSVDNQEQLLKAAQAIRNVPGVKAVVTTPVTVRNQSS